jgi:hypothetical protein
MVALGRAAHHAAAPVDSNVIWSSNVFKSSSSSVTE